MQKQCDAGCRRSGIRTICGWLCAVAAAAVWLPGADVAELIVLQQDVVLGRYDENQAYFMLLFSPLCLAIAALLLSRADLNRVMAFKVLSVVVSCILGLVLVDVTARMFRDARYEETSVEDIDGWPHEWNRGGNVKTRPPGVEYRVRYEDVPSTARTYPNAPPGFEPVDVVLSVDGRGFRNPAALDRADIVILGDSFAEGSRVDDSEVWGRMLEELIGRRVYNLAISGGAAGLYLNHLLMYGFDLKPDLVLCMVYEGNDFKRDRSETRSLWKRISKSCKDTVKYSPLVLALRNLSRQTLCTMFADRPVAGWDDLSWMPLRIASEHGEHHVAFQPKRLERLYFTPEQFRKHRGWKHTQKVLREMQQACDAAGVQLVFVYAPSAPHVMLPVAIDNIPARGLRRFLRYAKGKLPESEKLKSSIPDIVETCEQEFAAFAEAVGAGFISPTEALRAAVAGGAQVYYTYDQHWTRNGHAVVAEQVAAWLQAHPEVFAAQ